MRMANGEKPVQGKSHLYCVGLIQAYSNQKLEMMCIGITAIITACIVQNQIMKERLFGKWKSIVKKN